MAGDWIKIEHGLLNKPEVMLLADALDVSHFEAVGHLVAFWLWVDLNLSPSCPQVKGTKRGLDRVAGRDGFADALVSVGWLRIEKDASFHWMKPQKCTPKNPDRLHNSSIDIEDGWATIRLDKQRRLGYILLDLSETIVVSIESTFRSELVDVAYLDWTDPHLIEIIQELLSNRCYTYLNEAANNIRAQYQYKDATIKIAYECQKAMAAAINNAIDKIRTAA